MTMWIKTTISSTDPDKVEVGQEIEDTILEFLESEEAKAAIQNDEYKIIVLSKDKKKIN
ncbi:hypothetical protein CUU64_14095 [Bacillus sp. V5-8f]|nr:hypothetical protein CUU64_14095 [Bacillus sp. V5-8f]